MPGGLPFGPLFLCKLLPVHLLKLKLTSWAAVDVCTDGFRKGVLRRMAALFIDPPDLLVLSPNLKLSEEDKSCMK